MKLHIGGLQKKEGWKILNIQSKPGVDYIGDISNLDQFQDESIEEIYASHVFEHVKQKDVLKTLKEINRKLIKGGKFYVSVPDMDVLCKLFISPKATPKIKIHVMKMIFGGQIDDYDFHYFGWNYQFLSGFLKDANFSKINKVEKFGLFEDTSEYKPYGVMISLNVIAIK